MREFIIKSNCFILLIILIYIGCSRCLGYNLCMEIELLEEIKNLKNIKVKIRFYEFFNYFFENNNIKNYI